MCVIDIAMTDQYQSVSEIKGATCTRCAHFHDWVHDFRRCARFLSMLL